MQAKIDTISRRKTLPVTAHPIWTSVGDARSGLKLGYRKGTRGGVWSAKLVSDGARVEATLAPADDGATVPAKRGSADDGPAKRHLNYAEAMQAALAWADGERARLTGSAQADRAERERVTTVGDVLKGYVADRARRDPVNGPNAGHRLGKHALSDKKFVGVRLDRFSARDLTEWRNRLPQNLAPATVDRTVSDVKAGLNAYADAHWRTLPATLKREIQLGAKRSPNAQRARKALLRDADVQRVIEAGYGVDPDLGALVLVLAGTGARFRQVRQITVGDVQADASRIMTPVSAKGRGRKQRSEIAVPVGADVIARLKPLLAGRAGYEPLLQHWVGVKGFGHMTGPVRREAWRAANQMQKGWRTALAAAGLPYIEPYSLRHSNIVRGLRSGVPVRIVAALHDTSSTMIEQHYSAFILDAADELARRAIVPLVSQPVAPLSIVA
jgi:integrase